MARFDLWTVQFVLWTVRFVLWTAKFGFEQYGSFFERHGSFCEQYALTKKWLQALWTVRFDFFYYNFVYFFSEGLQQGVYYEKPFFSNRYFYDILQMYFKLIKIRTPMRYSVFNTLCKTCLPSLLSESGV